MSIVPFTPANGAAFQFQAQLDGLPYTIQTTWNVFGQRWYVNCFDSAGNLIFARPMVGSPPGYDISLSAGFFASTLVFRQAAQQFEITP